MEKEIKIGFNHIKENCKTIQDILNLEKGVENNIQAGEKIQPSSSAL
ncbi:MAG: hypothetical protein KKF48_02625 [Nanoarchaeota archaeon]|nr:hypothetical protein [Nanoarchaeota archaeon]